MKDLAPLAGDSDYDSAELWVTAGVRESGPWGVVESTGRSLARRLEQVLAEGRELMTQLEEWGGELTDQRADLAGLLTRLAEQHTGLVAVVDGEDDTLVYSAVLDRRPQAAVEKLVAARLDIGEALADDLYPRTQSVVYTSATIATGDSFAHFARSVGLDRLPEESWRALRLASSYDFERQMAVFVPTDMPDPREGGYLGALEALLERVHLAMGGSVLTLFTNRRDMERLHAVLEPRLRSAGLDVIVQRRGTSAKRLRDEFLADESLSLFALKSFWEGFDAKGDTLRCVVVPKLPVRPAHRSAGARARAARRPRGVGPLRAARGGARAQAGGRAADPLEHRRGLPGGGRLARAAHELRARLPGRAAGGRHRAAAHRAGRRADRGGVSVGSAVIPPGRAGVRRSDSPRRGPAALSERHWRPARAFPACGTRGGPLPDRAPRATTAGRWWAGWGVVRSGQGLARMVAP